MPGAIALVIGIDPNFLALAAWDIAAVSPGVYLQQPSVHAIDRVLGHFCDALSIFFAHDTCRSVIPWVLPAQKGGAVLLRAVHQLPLSASALLRTNPQHTKNHIDAPRPVAMNRYSGRTGWMWMGWFGCGGYLGGPMRESVGCIV